MRPGDVPPDGTAPGSLACADLDSAFFTPCLACIYHGLKLNRGLTDEYKVINV